MGQLRTLGDHSCSVHADMGEGVLSNACSAALFSNRDVILRAAGSQERPKNACALTMVAPYLENVLKELS